MQCLIASAHPMRSFANPGLSVTTYQGTYCSIEGNEKALPTCFKLFADIGSITYKLKGDKKSLYHCAGVIASNYLVSLCYAANGCLLDAGVDEEIAINLVLSLMQGTLKNLQATLSPEKSLTGPIQRGDQLTIRKHLEALPNRKLSELYRILGLITLEVAQLDKEKELHISEILTNTNHKIMSKL
jgi:predicted short-subunit dehydrogenase-like oxidoreductase (DUF2520 family)